MILDDTYSAATRTALSGENGQLARRMVWQTDWLWVSDSVWDRSTHPDVHDVNATTCIEVMWSGAFLRRRGPDRAIGDAHHAGFFNCGEGGSLHHPGQTRTEGTTLIPAQDLVAAMLRDAGGLRVRDEANPFPWLSRPIHSRTHVALQHFRTHLAALPLPDPVAAEERALHLLEAVIIDASREPDVRVRRPRTGRARDRVLDAAAFLASEFRRPLRLSDLAAQLGCNPSHASRLFREVTGIPMSRYLAALRVRHAARLILAGAESLADVALESGFAHHSHLTAIFRREVGCTPRSLRGDAVHHWATTTLRTSSPSPDRRRTK